MQRIKSFEDNLYKVNEINFQNIAISLFHQQFNENKVYKQFVTLLGVDPTSVTSLDRIPFLPISFFKDQDVVTGEWTPEVVFSSSGTTGTTSSLHKVKSLSFYLENAENIFRSAYGNLEDFHFLALLPSYLERSGSSLIAMLEHFIKKSKSAESGFYLYNQNDLLQKINTLRNDSRKIILWGVSFALLELAEKHEIDLSHCIIMETGGMKGKRKEVTREELHAFLGKRFNTPTIHSEYGMTELLSQAYSHGGGYFKASQGMKMLCRDINDPFTFIEMGKIGGINVIDLVNIYSCAFIETQDLGRIDQNGNFEILGRLDNSDIRGCNLLVN